MDNASSEMTMSDDDALRVVERFAMQLREVAWMSLYPGKPGAAVVRFSSALQTAVNHSGVPSGEWGLTKVQEDSGRSPDAAVVRGLLPLPHGEI